jgi:hypothetical protein
VADVNVADDEAPTIDEAIRNAARLLRHAETETNLALMERLDEMAATWLNVAHLLMERQHDLS